jgi:hypothetical protein
LEDCSSGVGSFLFTTDFLLVCFCSALLRHRFSTVLQRFLPIYARLGEPEPMCRAEDARLRLAGRQSAHRLDDLTSREKRGQCSDATGHI